MPRELIVPATIMTFAFAFYTTGVWAERIVRDLHVWHVAFFWLGLGCDTAATEMMLRLVSAGQNAGWIHLVTGIAALVLMGVHAIWATFTLLRGTPQARAAFHRYSIAVWAVWLVPYIGGMVAGIMRGRGLV